jgi:PPOX class probable F420-dependent enzyme
MMPTSLDPANDKHAAALERLTTEMIAWLTTVDPDGQPQASPIWFLWDDGEVLLFSDRRARRNGNLADHPRVAFNLNTDAAGGAVLSMEGEARLVPDEPSSSTNAAYQAKYGGWIADYGWTTAWFEEHYPYAIRITPTRWRLAD